MSRHLSFSVNGLPPIRLAHSDRERERAFRAWRAGIAEKAGAHRIAWIRQSTVALKVIFQLEEPKGEHGDWAPTGFRATHYTDHVIDALISARVLIDPKQIAYIEIRKRYGDPGVAVLVTDSLTAKQGVPA
jgi:Holliday junction resolvase RusA-like endonuclease